jgi:hypothetical protein
MSTPIHVAPADYWRVKAKLARVQLLRAQLRAAVLEQQAEIDRLAREGQADFAAVAKQYGFDAAAPCMWDDDTTSVTLQEETQ